MWVKGYLRSLLSWDDADLRFCSCRRTDRHYPETAASTEQCSSDCAPSAEAIPRQAVTAPAALVASTSSSGSHTSWQFWRTKFGACPLRFTYTAESQNVPAAELYVHLPSRCWSNRSWEQTSLGVLSGFLHHLSGTRCHKQFSSVILSILNPDLKLFCSIRLLPNTDPTCHQRHWS